MAIAELIAGFVGGGFVGYLVKYFFDRRMQIKGEILAQKRLVYSQAADTMRIFLSGFGESSPGHDKFLAAYSHLWLWGSDPVLHKLNSFLELVRTGDEEPLAEHQKRLRRTFGATMLRMRKDLVPTDLTEGDYRFITF